MEVKLAQMALENGTIIEAEVFEAGASVFIVNEEDRIALPVGEYKLEDGMILIVAEEGIIAEIKEMEAPVAEEAPAEVEVEVEQEMAEVKEPKRVIESVTKEMFFAEIESLRKEIEELKLAKVEVKIEEVELSAEPLTHNPDATTKRELNLFSQNRTKTTFDSVLNKISNFK
jgi:alanyl-tRNA synthetase